MRLSGHALQESDTDRHTQTVFSFGCLDMWTMSAQARSPTISPALRAESTTIVQSSGVVRNVACNQRQQSETLRDLSAIGPSRLYNIGKIYSGLLHMFWLGAALPILTFLLQKKWPNSKTLKSVHWPIFFAGTGNLPPAVCALVIHPFAFSFTTMPGHTKPAL